MVSGWETRHGVFRNPDFQVQCFLVLSLWDWISNMISHKIMAVWTSLVIAVRVLFMGVIHTYFTTVIRLITEPNLSVINCNTKVFTFEAELQCIYCKRRSPFMKYLILKPKPIIIYFFMSISCPNDDDDEVDALLIVSVLFQCRCTIIYILYIGIRIASLRCTAQTHSYSFMLSCFLKQLKKINLIQDILLLKLKKERKKSWFKKLNKSCSFPYSHTLYCSLFLSFSKYLNILNTWTFLS